MKLLKLLCVFAVLAVVLANIQSVESAQRKSRAKAKAKSKMAGPPSPAEMEAMMKQWEKWGAPHQGHKRLEPLVGSWEITAKMWMAPGAPPTESKGSSQVESIFDGRFLKEEMNGEFGGMAMQGMGILGYDNFRKEYIGNWIDNMGTSMLVMKGGFDKSGKVLTMVAMHDDPMTGQKNIRMRMVTRILSDDQHVFQIFDRMKNGKEYKLLEATYTRQ